MHWSKLPPRQKQIASLIADGCDVHQIAERLGISYRTVKAAMPIILARTGVRNRAELATSVQKARQRIQVMDAYEDGARTVREVVEMTGLPRNHVSAYTWSLVGDGLLKDLGRQEPKPGPCSNVHFYEPMGAE